MDTKSKDRAKYVRPVSLLLLVAVAVGYVSLFPFLKREAVAGSESFFERDEFIEELYRGGYVLYWRLNSSENNSIRDQERWEGVHESTMTEALTLADLFFPQDTAELRSQIKNGAREAEARLEELTSAVQNAYMQQVARYFMEDYLGMEYLAIDHTSRSEDPTVVGSGGKVLTQYLKDSLSDGGSATEEVAELQKLYQYYVVLEYDRGGEVTVKDIHGAQAWSLNRLSELEPTWWNYLATEPDFYDNDSMRWRAAKPSGMTVVYAVPVDLVHKDYGSIAYEQERYILNSLRDYQVEDYFYLAMLFAACLGLGAGLLTTKPAKLLNRIPLEIAAAMAIVPLAFSSTVSGGLYHASTGEYLFRLGLSATNEPVVFPPEGRPSIVVGYILCFLLVLLLAGVEYAACYSVGQVRSCGLREYLAKRSIIVRNLSRLGRMFTRLVRWVTAIDLREKSERTVLKVVLANFVIITLFTCFWFFGIIGTVLYSILLFFFLRRYLKEVKGQYETMLRVTREMAMGRLDVEVQGSLGVFDPLMEELQTIRTGFRKAVEDEVKSRSMKTELVANVSHDLKTPLTAIITYIGLLKDESITDEARREYVETLDKKAQRLGRLIEDLFEMSKATTGNLTLQIAPVDLPSLVRQVELELEGEIQASGVEFRNRFSEEKAGALLDGERTYRVFENLILNVTKYALSGTRAYVDIVARGGNVITKISNVSREPLDFDTEDITERFVRGDRSRGTEGSGLGLAIAKSLVELQGGKLSVSVDGDLFKVTVIFPASIAP